MKKIFKNAAIITQNSKREVFTNGMLIVNNNKIEYVGSTIDIDMNGKYEIVDLDGKVVLPGLINVHTHLQASTLKGTLEGLGLEQYLVYNEKIREGINITTQKKYKEIAIKVGMLESIRSGITTVCSSNCETIAKEFGMRVYTGPLIMNVKRLKDDYKKLLTNTLYVRNESDMVNPILFVHSLYKIDIKILPIIKKYLEKNPQCLLSIHIAETQEEVEYIFRCTGMYPVELLDSFGLVGASTLLVHCTFIKQFEVEIIAKRGAKIVVCPASNIRLGEEIPNVPLFQSMGIKLCIATDGMATNGSFDMLFNARITYYAMLLKYGYRLSAQSLLDMISIDAANVLEVQTIGSLEKEKNADFLIFKNNTLALQPSTNLIDNVIFSGNCEQIQDIYINGVQILKNGEFDFLLDEIVNEYNKVAIHLEK